MVKNIPKWRSVESIAVSPRILGSVSLGWIDCWPTRRDGGTQLRNKKWAVMLNFLSFRWYLVVLFTNPNKGWSWTVEYHSVSFCPKFARITTLNKSFNEMLWDGLPAIIPHHCWTTSLSFKMRPFDWIHREFIMWLQWRPPWCDNDVPPSPLSNGLIMSTFY